MGSQQLLLIIVGVLMIGLSIAIGITLFSDSAAASNRDAVGTDLESHASKAQVFYRRPKSMGGGGSSFVGFTLTEQSAKNHNGEYDVSGATSSSVTIQGTGHEIGYDRSTPVMVAITVTPDSILVTELN